MYDTQVSVSHTTRKPRPGEVHGEHYFFVDHDEFKAMIGRDAFLEHAEVFGNYYGTSRETIEQVLATGVNVFWISTGRARSKFARKCLIRAVSLFYRRRKMSWIAACVAAVRTAKRSLQSVWNEAVAEMSHYAEYDYLIVNDDFDAALSDLKTILRAERLRMSRQKQRHDALITKLLAD